MLRNLFIFVGVVLFVLYLVNNIYVGSYIEFRDENGTVCGCMINDDPPSLEQCNTEGLEEPVVITVSKC